jgi:hypothetical protein
MTNVACSTATEVDSGTTENLTGGHPYGVGYGVGYGSSVYGSGYGFGVNLAEDSAP